MVIRSFKDEDAENFFKRGIAPRKKGWAKVEKIVKRKLDMLDYSKDLKDLLSPPSNCLENLKGDLKGFYSIRVNDQWRIIFKWDKEPYDVRVIDYH